MINKIKRCNKNQLFLTFYLIINIIYLPLGMYIEKTSKFTYQNFSQGMIILLLINIIMILFIVIKKKYRKNIIDYFIIIIFILGTISTIFAFRYDYSLFGFKGRYEGLLQIIYYLTIFFITTFLDKKNKKIIIYSILLTGIVQIYFAYNQFLYKTSLMTIGKVWFDIIKGLTTNSNFLGSYLLICLCFSIGIFMNGVHNIEKYTSLLLIVIFMCGLLLTNALSSAVGLIFIIIFLLIFCIKNNKIMRYGIVIIIIVITSLIMNNNNSTKILKDLSSAINQTKSIVTGDIDESYGTNRIYIWKNTLNIVSQNLTHGVGIDNFYYVFDGGPLKNKESKTFYDKAHNEYLQILVTQGLLALIAYLGFYYIIIKNGIQNKNIYMLLPVMGYLVQAFFNISVIEVAPLFYISCGLLYDRKTIEKKSKKSYNIYGGKIYEERIYINRVVSSHCCFSHNSPYSNTSNIRNNR